MNTLRTRLGLAKANGIMTRLSDAEATDLMVFFEAVILNKAAAPTAIKPYQNWMYIFLFTSDHYSEYGDMAKLLDDLTKVKVKSGSILSKSLQIDRIDTMSDGRTGEACYRWKVRYWDDISDDATAVLTSSDSE